MRTSPQQSPEAYATRLGRTAVKAGYMFGLSGVEKWQRRFFVLKPATLLYSFGSSQDEEPLGCVDVESFERCECTGLEADGSVVIELLRHSGQTLKLKATDPAWFDSLKNETYSRLKESVAILRKQRDDFASDITRLEDFASKAKTAADMAISAKDSLAHKFGMFVDSLATTLCVDSSSTGLTPQQHRLGVVCMGGKDSLIAVAVRRLVDQRKSIEEALEATEKQSVHQKEALEATVAALVATLAAERRKNRTLKLANEKLNIAVFDLTKQRKALCLALKSTCRTRRKSQTPLEACFPSQRRTSCGISICNRSQRDGEGYEAEARFTQTSKIETHEICEEIRQDDEQHDVDDVLSTTTTPTTVPVASLNKEERLSSRRSKFKRCVKEAALGAIQRTEAETSAYSKQVNLTEACYDATTHANVNVRITFPHARLGVVFMSTADGGIKVAGVTNDYNRDLPRLPRHSTLVAVNGQPLVLDDTAANLRTLKNSRRPLILDFRVCGCLGRGE